MTRSSRIVDQASADGAPERQGPEAALAAVGTEVADVMNLDAFTEKGLNDPQVHGVIKKTTAVLVAAIFRWKKALQADPGSAVAHSVAYEKKGLFQDALREYEAALKIDPANTYVKSNYRNCKENIQSSAKDEEKKKGPDDKK